MKAMIFAAGLGTRLYPLTKKKPKALAPFMGETLLSYNLRFLAKQGIDHFVINTHHYADKIEQYLDEHNCFNLRIDISNETSLLDTAGGIAKAKSFFGKTKEAILLYNVDVICNLNLSKILSIHQKCDNIITLAVRNRNTSRYLLFNDQNTLKGWQNRSNGALRPNGIDIENLKAFAFSGIQLFSPEALNLLEENRIYSLIDLYLEEMTSKKIGGYLHDADYWFDCGKIESLQLAEEHVFQITPQ